MTLLQNVDTRAILEKMLLDYFVERRRALLSELKSVDAQLVILRGEDSNAERKQLRGAGGSSARDDMRVQKHERS